MLTLTPGAAAVLAEARDQNGLSEEVGLRISAGPSSNGQAAAYELRFAAEPNPDDLVVDSGGTRLFVAAEVAQPLETAVLDAQETDQGRKLVLKRDH